MAPAQQLARLTRGLRRVEDIEVNLRTLKNIMLCVLANLSVAMTKTFSCRLVAPLYFWRTTQNFLSSSLRNFLR